MTEVNGTPPSFPAVASPATLEALDVPRVLEIVAQRAAGALGADAVRARRPVADPAAVREELERVTVLARLLAGGDPFRAAPVEDLSRACDLLEKGDAPLDGPDLVRVRRGLGAMHSVAAELDRVREAAPALTPLRAAVPPAMLRRRLEQALDPDGRVPDGADAGVDRARRRVQDARARLIDVLERALRKLDSHEAPPDASVTQRGGRYVIPVLRDARGRLSGIVHAESSSGATLFVEPEQAVGPGNDLAAAEAAETRAVIALFRDLTDTLRPQAAALRAGVTMCVAVDDLTARARYAVDVDAVPPETGDAAGPYRIRGARHPLLMAEGVDTVPFTLELEADERCVIVSGPNTGGKTVLLKGVGLLSLMLQSGILPPVGQGTVLPLFRRVIADIGDHQSIAASLSTFSAHLAAVRDALAGADAATLVLLDEVGTGTDPVEGAALAGAVLLTLTAGGARTVATTHLGALKDLAGESDGVINASLQFDAASLTPTYRLLRDVPGRSYGLVMARRLGLPDGVVDAAEARIPDAERDLDALLAEVEQRARDLESQWQDLEARRLELDADDARAASRREDLDALESRLRGRERELEREGRRKARAFLLDARKRVEEALGAARAAVDEATAREARRHVEEGIREEAEELKRLEARLQERGWTVKVGGDRTPPPPHRGGAASRGAPAARAASPADTAVTEIDVRGSRADEARMAVLQALDAAVVADLPVVRIIHGKGTGALRQVVDEIARGDRRVQAHRLAPPSEGGTGVTVLELSGA